MRAEPSGHTVLARFTAPLTFLLLVASTLLLIGSSVNGLGISQLAATTSAYAYGQTTDAPGPNGRLPTEPRRSGLVPRPGAVSRAYDPPSNLVRTNALPAVRFFAPQMADDLVDLTTPAARRHILGGEVRPDGSFSGGHRPGTGFSGKSEFPGGWSDGRILHEISDIATDPAATRVVQGSRTIVTGTRNGVDVRVVIDNQTGQIVTGYPTNLPRNP